MATDAMSCDTFLTLAVSRCTTAPQQPLSDPPPPLSDWANFPSGSSANQNFSLAPSVQGSLGQNIFFGASNHSGSPEGGGGPPHSPPPPPLPSPPPPPPPPPPPKQNSACDCLFVVVSLVAVVWRHQPPVGRALPACRPPRPPRSKGWFVEPTVIVTTDPNSKLMTDEIFGPVLTVYVYEPEAFEGHA